MVYKIKIETCMVTAGAISITSGMTSLASHSPALFLFANAEAITKIRTYNKNEIEIPQFYFI